MARKSRPATITVTPDRRLVPVLENAERHLLIKLTAPDLATPARAEQRPGVNVAFVLDRSGSMAGSKLFLARGAVARAIAGLTERDRFAIVAYDDRVDVVSDSAIATDHAKRDALTALNAVDSRGSTALHAGWARGAELAKAHLDAAGVNRVLLLTDGLANVGESNPQTLAGFAADLRASGVTTTTFGVGADFDEALLQAIADAGGGHFYFIEQPEQIPDFMTGELGELLDTVARVVTLSVTHPPQIAIKPMTPVANRANPVQIDLQLGDLVAGQVLEVVLTAFVPPALDVGQQAAFFVTVGDRDGVLGLDGVTVTIESADAAACKAEKPNREVERVVAKLKVAQARQDAVQLHRSGDFQKASNRVAVMRRTVANFRDPEMLALQQQLIAETHQFLAPMSELDRKSIHYRGSNLARSRDAVGKARRGGREG